MTKVFALQFVEVSSQSRYNQILRQNSSLRYFLQLFALRMQDIPKVTSSMMLYIASKILLYIKDLNLIEKLLYPFLNHIDLISIQVAFVQPPAHYLYYCLQISQILREFNTVILNQRHFLLAMIETSAFYLKKQKYSKNHVQQISCIFLILFNNSYKIYIYTQMCNFPPLLQHKLKMNRALYGSSMNEKRTVGQYVKGMIQQVSSSISHLLQNLSFIYFSHGVKFQVDHLHETLVRLLTPFQLLSSFHVTDNKELLTQDFLRKYPLRNKQPKQSFINEYQNFQSKAISENEPVFKFNQNQNKQNLNKYLSQRSSNRSHPILGKEREKILCAWTLQQLKQNKSLLLRDVSEQAKILGKDIENFNATVSWVRKFLNRFPQLKQKLNQARNERRAKNLQIRLQKKRLKQSRKQQFHEDQQSEQKFIYESSSNSDMVQEKRLSERKQNQDQQQPSQQYDGQIYNDEQLYQFMSEQQSKNNPKMTNQKLNFVQNEKGKRR